MTFLKFLFFKAKTASTIDQLILSLRIFVRWLGINAVFYFLNFFRYYGI